MSPEAQRIAIANACPHWCPIYNDDGKCTLVFYVVGDIAFEVDPLSDLNACHEMEKTLDGVTAFAYFKVLATVCRYPVIATAGERAEAFLRTLSKWDDTR